MNKITVNNKEFKSKKEAIKYIEDLEKKEEKKEILVVKIFAYPDLNEGTHGPHLKDEYHFKAYQEFESFKVKERIKPIIAPLRNALIEIYGKEYGYVMGGSENPLKYWDVEVNFEMSNEKGLKNIDIDKLVEDVKESFKDSLY